MKWLILIAIAFFIILKVGINMAFLVVVGIIGLVVLLLFSKPPGSGGSGYIGSGYRRNYRRKNYRRRWRK